MVGLREDLLEHDCRSIYEEKCVDKAYNKSVKAFKLCYKIFPIKHFSRKNKHKDVEGLK